MSDLISREDLIKSIDFDVPLNQYERDTLNLVLKRIKALPTVDREESVLQALEDVLAEIHETGVLDHHSDEIAVALAYGKVETIIEQKIAEVKGDKT